MQRAALTSCCKATEAPSIGGCCRPPTAATEHWSPPSPETTMCGRLRTSDSTSTTESLPADKEPVDLLLRRLPLNVRRDLTHLIASAWRCRLGLHLRRLLLFLLA